MAYTDNNTPVIEKITLPSGNTYFIADREIRDVVDTLSQTVAGGVSYTVAWDGTSEPTVGNIPAGVVVTYDGTDYTGTMVANNATPGAFYLVKSNTQVNGKDVYDEYVPVGADGSKSWEKIGDTQINLTDIVTAVSLSKQTDTVIGSDATLTLTNPTVTPTIGSTSGTGKVNTLTAVSASKTNVKATASGANTAWNSKDQVTAITGVQVTAQPTVALSSNNTTATGRVEVADGTGTASSTNTDWLKGVSVSNGVLTLGAATLDTTYLGASASGTAVGASSTDTVIGSDATFTVTQPTIALSTDATAGTGVVNLATDVSGTTEYIGVEVTGGSVAWNSKDQVTVLKDTTDVSVTKGSI